MLFNLLGSVVVIYVVMVLVIYLRQRSMLFLPSHEVPTGRLLPWKDDRGVIGYAREVAQPRMVWLMLHGNAGQAADRDYVLGCMAASDGLYVLEYPGFGQQPGIPSLETMNRAAAGAYALLRARFPNTPVGVIGESIGSGPACALAGERVPPDKIVLAVPFDTLASVAARHMSFVPVGLLLKDRWDNVAALKSYSGPIDVYGAELDSIIPVTHARALAASRPQARFIPLRVEHNDWSSAAEVKIGPEVR